MERHERFEELAVGHVLGGLDPVDGAEFRSHLLGCRDCRLRVAELRDLASDLAAAERDERAASRLKTEVAQQQAASEQQEPPGPPRAVALAVLAVGLAALVALGFYSLHLRQGRAQAVDAAARISDTLEVLASAPPVARFAEATVQGLVTADATRYAASFARVPGVGPDEALVIWTVARDGDSTLVRALRDADLPDGALAWSGSRVGATDLVLTVQPAADLGAPAGREIVRVDLDAGDPDVSGAATTGADGG